MTPKSKEELKKEQQEAQAQLEALLNQTKPKNFRQGVSTGVNNILAGAIGAAGVAVIAPTLGFATGLKQGGILGGALGAAGGAVIGALGAVGLLAGGALSGGEYWMMKVPVVCPCAGLIKSWTHSYFFSSSL